MGTNTKSGAAGLRKTNKSRREEYSEATRLALVEAARSEFAAKGYLTTSVDTLVTRARVTKGALYHHFKDKKALFEAVLIEMQVEAMSEVWRQANAENDSWDRMKAGIAQFLQCCLEPSYRQVVILDGPSVLGFKRWRQIDQEYPVGLMLKGVNELAAVGEIDVRSADTLGSMLSAAVCEASFLVAESSDRKKAEKNVWRIMSQMLEAFRK